MDIIRDENSKAIRYCCPHCFKRIKIGNRRLIDYGTVRPDTLTLAEIVKDDPELAAHVAELPGDDHGQHLYMFSHLLKLRGHQPVARRKGISYWDAPSIDSSVITTTM